MILFNLEFGKYCRVQFCLLTLRYVLNNQAFTCLKFTTRKKRSHGKIILAHYRKDFVDIASLKHQIVNNPSLSFHRFSDTCWRLHPVYLKNFSFFLNPWDMLCTILHSFSCSLPWLAISGASNLARGNFVPDYRDVSCSISNLRSSLFKEKGGIP